MKARLPKALKAVLEEFPRRRRCPRSSESECVSCKRQQNAMNRTRSRCCELGKTCVPRMPTLTTDVRLTFLGSLPKNVVRR